MSDTEIIDWLEQHGASVNMSEQPDMDVNNWHIRCDSIPSSRKVRGLSIRDAVERASRVLEALS